MTSGMIIINYNTSVQWLKMTTSDNYYGILLQLNGFTEHIHG